VLTCSPSRYNHIHWVYAFRFLKAAFHLQSGTATDHQALENLKKMAFVAQQRADNAIFVMAAVLEGMAHFSSMKPDWVGRVRECIAQASKLQLEASARLLQIDVLLLLLDIACCIHQRTYESATNKLAVLNGMLTSMKNRATADPTASSSEVLLPVFRPDPDNPDPTISNDTRAVLRPGEGEADYLVLPTLDYQEFMAVL
jgi:hypothetical protein